MDLFFILLVCVSTAFTQSTDNPDLSTTSYGEADTAAATDSNAAAPDSNAAAAPDSNAAAAPDSYNAATTVPPCNCVQLLNQIISMLRQQNSDLVDQNNELQYLVDILLDQYHTVVDQGEHLCSLMKVITAIQLYQQQITETITGITSSLSCISNGVDDLKCDVHQLSQIIDEQTCEIEALKYTSIQANECANGKYCKL